MPTPSEARRRILEHVQPHGRHRDVPLERAIGHTLANPVLASIDVPPFSNSSMDGVAFSYHDLMTRAPLLLKGQAAAGDAPQVLTPGTAMGIFTGAVIPVGADTVVPIEDYVVRDGVVVLHDAPRVKAGSNVRARAEDLAVGDTVLTPGIRIRPADLGVAASLGVQTLRVAEAPKVALVMTGNEIRPLGQALEAGALYDSNTPMLTALATALGAEVVYTQRVADEAAATRAALSAAAERADLVITTGGVSVGEADEVKRAVEALGHVWLWKVSVKPGKPLAMGRVGNAYWIGLPGNPTSALVTFMLFAAPVLRQLAGRAVAFPSPWQVAAGFSTDGRQAREEYLRVARHQGEWRAHPRQGSGVLSSASWGEALARVPARTAIALGDSVDVWPFSELLF